MSDAPSTTASLSCPFCNDETAYTVTTTNTVAQHSHTATDRHYYECEACGYQQVTVWHGNARATTTQPWQPTKIAEQLPNRYCVIICSACESILGAPKIGERVEVHPEIESSECCDMPVEPVYTAHDVPGRTPLTERHPYWIALRLIYPHVADIQSGAMDASPRTIFETPDGCVIRVSETALDVTHSGTTKHATTESAHLIETKLRHRVDTTVRQPSQEADAPSVPATINE